jgi:hypothetical protein
MINLAGTGFLPVSLQTNRGRNAAPTGGYQPFRPYHSYYRRGESLFARFTGRPPCAGIVGIAVDHQGE